MDFKIAVAIAAVIVAAAMALQYFERPGFCIRT